MTKRDVDPMTDSAAALEAWKSGKDIDSALRGDASAPAELDEPQDDPLDVLYGDDSTPEEPESDADAKDEGSQDEPEAEADDSPEPQEGDSTTFKIGPKDVNIDFKNPESVKSALDEVKTLVRKYQKGMRKFQRERDDARRKAKSASSDPKLEKDAKDFRQLSKLWSEGGVQAVVDQLAKVQGKSWDDFIDAAIERRQLEEKNPDKAEALGYKDAYEKALAKVETLEARISDIEGNRTKDAEAQEEKALQQLIDPVYQRFSFDGKLDDSESEDAFNDVLWTRSINELQKLPEGTELTRTMVRKVFKKHRDVIARKLKAQAEGEADKIVKKKAKDAVEHMQSAVRSGQASKTSKDKWVDKYHKNALGALVDVLRDKSPLG